MTSLIRGFDQSLRDSISQLGPNTIIVQKFGALSFASGKSFLEIARRPNLRMEDARAIERDCPSVALVDVWLGAQGQQQSRLYYKNEKTRRVAIMGATENWSAVNFAKLEAGRLFTAADTEHRRAVVVLGNSPWKALFPSVDPIGKQVRIGLTEFTVIGVLGPRPSPGNFGGADEFALIPYGTHEKLYGKILKGSAKVTAGGVNPGVMRSAMIAVVPREGMRDAAMREVESVLRVRHNLKLDDPNDFDLATQDAVLKVWDQISRATFLALVVISSIALMVGGIGVMAIMMISVTERTREIGVRKALGARRREILWQFLIEAAFLTGTGGLIGVVMGSAIGFGIHLLSGFPVSLPIWSFALGIAFSGGVGIFFGLFPAVKASRLDPIEALRYE
jgi:putative ABC transport system permease protein